MSGDDMSEVLRTLLHEKPAMMLVLLRRKEKNYATSLAKSTDCTYSHTMKILDVFEKNGLIKSEKKGRVRYIYLTEKGEKVAELLDELISELGGE